MGVEQDISSTLIYSPVQVKNTRFPFYSLKPLAGVYVDVQSVAQTVEDIQLRFKY